jgi:hypothetical protein
MKHTILIGAFVLGAVIIAWQSFPGGGVVDEADALLPATSTIDATATPVTPTATPLPTTAQVHPTLRWVNAYSLNTVLGDAPVPVGAEITAYDPRGTLVGRSIVKEAGTYGIMAVYMDDPSTAEIDGAQSGEIISFRINGFPAQVQGPDSPVLMANGDSLELDLVASIDS